jgi:hypothetical protein
MPSGSTPAAAQPPPLFGALPSPPLGGGVVTAPPTAAPTAGPQLKVAGVWSQCGELLPVAGKRWTQGIRL